MENNKVTVSIGLKDWISLMSLHERRSSRQIEVSGAHGSVMMFNSMQYSRFFYISHVSSLARHLIELLVAEPKNGSDSLSSRKSNDEEIQCFIQMEDILSIENFSVTVTVENIHQNYPRNGNELNHDGPLFLDILSSAIIRPKMPPDVIGLVSIVEGTTTIDFAPSVDAVSLEKIINNKKPDLVFQQLGLLLHQLFSRGNEFPRMASPTSDTANNSSNNSLVEFPACDTNGGGSEKMSNLENKRPKQTINNAIESFKKMTLSGCSNSSLSAHGVPPSICRLISDLIGQSSAGDENGFECLNDVIQELIEIIDYPEIFLQDIELGDHVTKLDFGRTMFGREEQLSILNDTAIDVVNDAIATHEQDISTVRLTLIGGAPGSGKSCLVENLCELLRESDWLCIKSKFDRLRYCQPLSTISSAFDNFFALVAHAIDAENEIVIEEDEDSLVDLAEVGNDIVASMSRSMSSSAIADLSKLMPSLGRLFPNIIRRVVSDPDLSTLADENSANGNEAPSDAERATLRFHFLFYTLLRVMSNPDRPLLFFLDDLQWADRASLDLISSLLLDFNHLRQFGNEVNNSPCVYFVATYRLNELSNSHILTPYIEKFEQSNVLEVNRIILADMPKASINKMVSETLKLPTRQIRSLTSVIYGKTLGNPLHVKALMKSLVERSVLRFSLTDRRWVWDIASVKATAIDESIAELLARNLIGLPSRVQEALKIFSCFGVRVDEGILQMLSEDARTSDLMVSIQHAVNENVLEKHGSILEFPHDMVAQKAYELMSKEECGQIHYFIGTQLFSINNSSKDCHTSPISVVAIDHINRAKALGVTDSSMRSVFARLNLDAAQYSKEVSDFVSALSYCELGISYLDETRWESDHDLMILLHESACIACFVNAVPNKMTHYIEELLNHAKILEDKLKGYYVMIQGMIASGKIGNAIDKAFFILGELGHSLPTEATDDLIQQEISCTEALLRNVSKEDILAAPKMKDTRNLWAMKFLNITMTSVFFARPTLVPIIMGRMVKISVEHGYCSDSAMGLASFGHSLLRNRSNVEEGCRWGKIALALIESFKGQSMIPRLKFHLYSFLFFWVEPLQAVASKVIDIHHDALVVGDISTAAVSGMFYCKERLMCGAGLCVLDKECSAVGHTLRQAKQANYFYPHCSHHLVVLKLMGSEKNPFDVISGAMMNEDELLNHALSRNIHSVAQGIQCNRLLLAFFFDQFDEAAAMAEQYRMHPPAMRFPDVYHTFYEGLTAFRFARCSEDKKRWLDIGQKDLSSFQKWAADHSQWNFENMYLLLKAEYYFSLGNTEAAEEKYHSSIESARRHQFLHEEGLAMKLLANFYNANGIYDKAQEHFSKACGCFKKWGAFGLLQKLNDEC